MLAHERSWISKAMGVQQGELLWKPSQERLAGGRLTHFRSWLREHRSLDLPNYEAVYRWSVEDLEGFWLAIWDYFEVLASSPYQCVVEDPTMPGARWFRGSKLNYAENLLRGVQADKPAIFHRSELRPTSSLSGGELLAQVQSVASQLRSLGVGPGDRVAAYLPNIPEAVVAFLASASLGATWSSCSPDFGTQSVVDRFVQIEPKVLITVDGYRYGGKDLDRRPAAAELQAQLPSVEHGFEVAYLHSDGPREGTRSFSDLVDASHPSPLHFAQVDFDHPLWILYSSGTTGLPKAIVQGHGGILLEHLKVLAFHTEIGPRDRFFWFTTTGWMMWNYLVSGLAHGAGIVLYDGNPGFPDMGTLWSLAEETGTTYFGTSAAYIAACMKAGGTPKERNDLSRIRGVGSTGSPLSPEGFKWVYDNVNSDLALGSVSGGTDICSAFVASALELPVRAGEIATRCLGVSMEVWGDNGRPVSTGVGEMVITKPMPSMPIYLWGDPDGARYRSSYFEVYPGIWRHGDFAELLESGAVIIHGRSDSTLNRYGVRIGTAEIYRTVEALPEVREALVINLEKGDGELFMPLFVALSEGTTLDDALVRKLKTELRTVCSPRHVPDVIYSVPDIPKTLNGKKMEIPVRKILSGVPRQEAMSQDACQNPAALEAIVALASQTDA